jgi:hypothetical protein
MGHGSESGDSRLRGEEIIDKDERKLTYLQNLDKVVEEKN